jgi:D-amino-acid dehydrogenase
VQLQTNEAVTGFEHQDGRITKVITAKNAYEADTVILASGSWSRELAAKMKISIPLVPGRGIQLRWKILLTTLITPRYWWREGWR